MFKSRFKKLTGNSLRRLPRYRYYQYINPRALNINKCRNWELTSYNGEPIIYCYFEIRNFHEHDRCRLGFNAQKREFVRMGNYLRVSEHNGVRSAHLIEIPNDHFNHRDKTNNPDVWRANRLRKDRRSHKHSQRKDTLNYLCETLRNPYWLS